MICSSIKLIIIFRYLSLTDVIMKSVILLTVFVVSTSSAPLMGDYTISIESINDRKDMDRTYADWHTFVEKRGRKESAFAGHFEVKTKLEKPLVLWETYSWSETRGWSNFKIARLNKLSLCDNKIKYKYYDPYFIGNATFEMPECVITEGHMDISKTNKLDINMLMHDIMDKCVYGRFKVLCTVIDKNEIVYGGLEMIVKIEPKNENTRRKSN